MTKTTAALNNDPQPKETTVNTTAAPAAADTEDRKDTAPCAPLKKYRHNYVRVKGYNGESLCNGDNVASFLAQFEPDRVVRLAEVALELEAGELSAKYGKLNPGQRRMNAGNRIRAAVKRKDLTLAALKRAAKKV